MESCLFGCENELGLVVEARGGVRPAPAELAPALVNHVAGNYESLRSAPPERRIFLANGACVYADIGGHPEIATAECADPIDLAAQTIALRQMLAEAAATVGGVYGVPIRLIANNLDYAIQGAQTYGNHLNIFCPELPFDRVVEQITPLLVAMPILAGAGRVSFGTGSAGFELSQRAGFMACVTGKHTTGSRAMITRKDEALADRGSRIHLISMDTVISPWQLALVPAALALTLKVVETGMDIASPFRLANPIKALRAVSCDPSLTVALPLENGGLTTALEIQQHYCDMVARTLRQTSQLGWAVPMIDLWAEMIANLRVDPFLECGRLDWVTKLVIFTQQLERMQLSWREFSRWIYALGSVRRLKATFPELDLRLTGRPAGIRGSALGTLEGHFAQNGLSWKGFPRIWNAANQLCQQCLRFHVLGQDTGNACDHSDPPLIDQQQVDELKSHPPKGTRAEARGQAIRSAPRDATAWWTFIDHGQRRLVMEDPFGIDVAWRENRHRRNCTQEA